MASHESETVVVTGASGFIAQHCIVQLLQAGYRVRGTLRQLARADRVVTNVSAHVDAKERLTFVEADLSADAGWEQAVCGAAYVLHVASPLPRQPPKHEDDLIVPARDGALRVLRAASTEGVPRVVMTSSLAAIICGHPRTQSRVYDERDWSELGPAVGAYEKSKTIAERAAWEYVHGLPADRKLELSVVNPGLVLGPILDDDYGTSGEAVKKLMRRELPGCPRVGWSMVDVRDVAAMHVLAMTTAGAAGERFVCAGDYAWMIDVARVLDRHFRARGYRIPMRELPGWLVRLVARFDKTVQLVVNDLDVREDVSHEKARRILGWKPRGVEEMVLAMGESMIRYGVV